MRIYQGGPMRGYRNFNFQAFEEGAAYLQWLGHDVISPHTIDITEDLVEVMLDAGYTRRGLWLRDFVNVRLTDKFTIEAALRRDFAAITTCDAISFLPGWEASEGCAKEYSVATWIGLDVFVHDPWNYFIESPYVGVPVAVHQ